MSPPLCPRLSFLLVFLALTAACQKPAEKLFAVSTDAPSRAGLVPVEGGVLVGNEAGRLLRLGLDGEPLWRVELGREVAARPTVAGDSVVVGTVGGVLVNLALAQGTERWRLTGQPPVLTPLVSDGGSVYVVAPDGSVRALAVDSGEVRWRRPLPPEEPRPEATSLLPAPVLAGGVLVVALGDAGLVALSPQDGKVRWRAPVTGVLGLETQGEVLYVSTAQGQVLALGLADGEVRWQQRPSALLTSPPSLAQGHLWVGAKPDMLMALDPETGRVVTKLVMPAPLVTRVAEFQQVLLVPTRSSQGWLLALNRMEGPPAFSLRLDTPLLTPPVVLGDQLFVLGRDGRVLSWRLRPPK